MDQQDAKVDITRLSQDGVALLSKLLWRYPDGIGHGVQAEIDGSVVSAAGTVDIAGRTSDRPATFCRGDSHWGAEKAMIGAEERKIGFLFTLKQA